MPYYVSVDRGLFFLLVLSPLHLHAGVSALFKCYDVFRPAGIRYVCRVDAGPSPCVEGPPSVWLFYSGPHGARRLGGNEVVGSATQRRDWENLHQPFNHT